MRPLLFFRLYYDRFPWPSTADGEGLVLERSVPAGAGRNPAQWFAGPPSPGSSEALTSPIISNAGGVTNPGIFSAGLTGNLLSTGSAPTEVRIYWDVIDHGSDTGAWTFARSLNMPGLGPLQTNLTGLLPETTYFYRYYAINAHGEDWPPESTSFTTLSARPTVSNTGGPSNLSPTNAVLNGTLLSTGAAPTAVTVYYGIADGSTNPAAWTWSHTFGVQPAGPLSFNATGLTPDRFYYYRFYATNTYGEVWASHTEQFATPRAAPDVGHDGTSNITTESADLNGSLTSTGFAPTLVFIYFGSTDGGTNKGAWDSEIPLGPQGEGPLLHSVTGMADHTAYYYRFYATNALGEDWADASERFRTDIVLAPEPYQMKIRFCGYDKTEPLTNFPVLITLNESLSNFSFRTFASTNGADLRFWNDSRTLLLSHEPEAWDLDGDAQIWVRIPRLMGTTCIYAAWGDTNDIAPPIEPSDLGGLQLWLKADDGALTNGSGGVTNWLDRSGNAYHMSNVSGMPTFMTNVVGGLPGLRFNGNTSILQSPPLTAG
ncbi:MAG: hypothetical protein AAF492_18170, partial [Verrucomicrobiota bacterium]